MPAPCRLIHLALRLIKVNALHTQGTKEYICPVKKLRPQVLLMLFTILGVTGFQLFWLKQTYEREKKSLELKTDLAFRDAVFNLQASRLRLPVPGSDTPQIRDIKILSNDSSVTGKMTVQLNAKKGMLSTINVISRKLSDSVKTHGIKRMVVTHDQDFFTRSIDPGDSTAGNGHVLRFLYGVDSLQTPLNIKEIKAATAAALQKQQVDVPFTILKTDSAYKPSEDRLNEVTTGFAHPVIYRLIMGNSFFYLLKRIFLPLLFCLFLTVLTVLSFLLLYRNLRRQQRLTESKNEFIANMTHELKTPIATVSVAIEALRDFDAMHEPARTKEYLGIAGQELSRLSIMVDKVLRLSMFENRKIDLKYESFDLAVLLREVMQVLQLQFERCGADITQTLSGANFMINADRMHIASVLFNLLDNAIKYSPRNPVVQVSLLAEADQLIIKIADEGIGIDPEYREKVFEKFFRVPQGNMHNVKGYGLGLSYAAHIIKQHGGRICAESGKAAGTIFTIKLPREHAR